MNTKLKAVIILIIIIASLLPVYYLNRYLQKIIQPRQSLGRLFLYMLTGMLLVFVYTFLLVFFIKWLFPKA